MKHLLAAVALVVACALFAGCASDTPAAMENAHPKLIGTNWIVESIGDKPVLVRDARSTPSLTLSETESRVAAHGGVNRFAGTYRIDGDKLSLGPMASTRMAGPPDLDQQESAFASALSKVSGYRFDGDRLILTDGRAELVRLGAR